MNLKMTKIPELVELENLLNQHNDLVQVEQLTSVSDKGLELPVYGFTMGSKDPSAPTIGLFAGVHGLERIGTHVLLAFLKMLFTKTAWEEEWEGIFQNCRLISIPIVNPIGMAFNRRSNCHGVDLMRNAPVEAEGKTFAGISGQRISNQLPWYRGSQEEMEPESKALVHFVKKNMFASNLNISLDLHSGFGIRDRLWYPYAKSPKPFPDEHNIFKLIKVFERTYPYHIYKIEHQAMSYMTHGDLWDHLYDEYKLKNPSGIYLPMTLEMGSWLWVKKNPLQVFSLSGLFNPVKKHRYTRTMRRHIHLLEFLLKATRNQKSWV